MLAVFISWRRAPTARKIYQEIGGRSPILEQTQKQALALEAELGPNYKVFIVMRYWHPRADAVYRAVMDFSPEEVVLLPLYPHFSTTTTLSSLLEWSQVQSWQTDRWQTRVIKSYPSLPGLVCYYAEQLNHLLKGIKKKETCRILFSAHGLPEKVIQAGDPYQKQIVKSSTEIQNLLPDDVDCLVTYQSRVGPLKWLDPYTDEEIKRAGAEKKHLIIVPIAFVSEHSETLVELDIEYRKLAEESGVLSYHRVMTPQCDPRFIKSLAQLVHESECLPFGSGIYPCLGWDCPKKLTNPKVCCLKRG